MTSDKSSLGKWFLLLQTTIHMFIPLLNQLQSSCQLTWKPDVKGQLSKTVPLRDAKAFSSYSEVQSRSCSRCSFQCFRTSLKLIALFGKPLDAIRYADPVSDSLLRNLHKQFCDVETKATLSLRYYERSPAWASPILQIYFKSWKRIYCVPLRISNPDKNI